MQPNYALDAFCNIPIISDNNTQNQVNSLKNSMEVIVDLCLRSTYKYTDKKE